MKVLFLTKYSRKGASSRYRSYNYEKYFVKNNILPTYKPLFGDKYIDKLYENKKYQKLILSVFFVLKRFFFLLFGGAGNYDHVIVEAELFPHFNIKFDMFFLKRIKSFSLDFDDNISANYENTSNANKIPRLIKRANFVTVGNKWYFSEFEGNLIYLPTVIDLENYPVYNIADKKPELVWIGSPSTVKYLEIIEDPLIRLSEKYNFTLKIIGGKIDLDKRIKTVQVKWNSTTENAELAKSFLGIMPLHNTDWEKGKCGFKLIQYMASGLPVIGSDLPANAEIIEEGKDGYIAKDAEDWFKYIGKLLNDKETAFKMGEHARKRIEKHYSYQVWGDKYVNIIKEKCLEY